MGGSYLFWCPFSSVGGILARLSPPKRALPSIASAGCHSHCTQQCVTLGNQDRPDSLEDPCCSPALEPSHRHAVRRPRSGSWSHWQPLHPEDDRIQHFPPIGDLARPVGFLGQNSKRIKLIRRRDSSEISRDHPGRISSRLPADHGSVSCRYARKWSLLAAASSCKRCSARFSDSYLRFGIAGLSAIAACPWIGTTTPQSTCSKGAGMSPWAPSSAMAGFAQKLPHFSGGRVFTLTRDAPPAR